jgi:hypothetical protein
MTSREYYLQQAETALRLARLSTDIAQRLLALAAEYQQRAAAAENDPPKNDDKK